jgi:peptide methionine sulfoxide reductase MsrA
MSSAALCYVAAGIFTNECCILQAPVPIRTEVEDLRNYHKAEDYHQQYLAKGGRFGNAQSPAKNCDDPIRCYG